MKYCTRQKRSNFIQQVAKENLVNLLLRALTLARDLDSLNIKKQHWMCRTRTRNCKCHFCNLVAWLFLLLVCSQRLLDRLGFTCFGFEVTLTIWPVTYQSKNIVLSAWLGA